jgi:hypothetical protein
MTELTHLADHFLLLRRVSWSRKNPKAVTNADMTFPSADNDRLILVASFSLSPVAPVFD